MATTEAASLPVQLPFAEAPAWKAIGPGWRPLFGNHHDLGFSFEWHEFETSEDFNWGRSFHPGSIELCVNLGGLGRLSAGTQDIELPPDHFVFYFQGEPPLGASRLAAQRHRFITVEFSLPFLRENLNKHAANLHPLVASAVRGELRESRIAPPQRLLVTLHQLVESLRHCPVFGPAQEMWFRCKALEVAAHLFFHPPQGEMLCTRTQRLAQERVEQAKAILREHLHNPPSLEALSRLIHCSPFYLSRLFTQKAGMTMQQYLRRIRMEKAAELLRTGRCNVTEAALEVGYSSLSHFSRTFHETFGCCPGLYPLKTPSQQRIISATGEARDA